MICNHAQSYFLWAATMRDDCHMARECESYADYMNGYCSRNTLSDFGWNLNVDNTTSVSIKLFIEVLNLENTSSGHFGTNQIVIFVGHRKSAHHLISFRLISQLSVNCESISLAFTGDFHRSLMGSA